MVEPTSSAGSAFITFSLLGATAVMPGVNGEALIGAFAGAALFALHAKDLALPKRLVYMLISVMVGYLGEDEVTRWTHIEDSAVAAFVAAAFVVTGVLAGIDWLRKVDFSMFWPRR